MKLEYEKMTISAARAYDKTYVAEDISGQSVGSRRDMWMMIRGHRTRDAICVWIACDFLMTMKVADHVFLMYGM